MSTFDSRMKIAKKNQSLQRKHWDLTQNSFPNRLNSLQYSLQYFFVSEQTSMILETLLSRSIVFL